MAKIKLVVTGGREFADKKLAARTLNFLHYQTKEGIEFIVNGYARGADQICDEWALFNGFVLGENLFREPISKDDWEKYKNGAGPRRNQLMLGKYHPNLCAAFPGGNGTADMIRRCRSAGLLVLQACA